MERLLCACFFYAYTRLGEVESVKDGTGTRTLFYEDGSEPALDGLLHKESLKVGSPSGPTYSIEYDYDSARRRLSELRHGMGTPSLAMAFGYRSSAPVGLLQTITATGGSVPVSGPKSTS